MMRRVVEHPGGTSDQDNADEADAVMVSVPRPVATSREQSKDPPSTSKEHEERSRSKDSPSTSRE